MSGATSIKKMLLGLMSSFNWYLQLDKHGPSASLYAPRPKLCCYHSATIWEDSLALALELRHALINLTAGVVSGR